MGRTLSQISRECGLATWDHSSTLVKTKIKYSAVPHTVLSNQLEVPGFTDDEIGDMVSYICNSRPPYGGGHFFLLALKFSPLHTAETFHIVNLPSCT